MNLESNPVRHLHQRGILFDTTNKLKNKLKFVFGQKYRFTLPRNGNKLSQGRVEQSVTGSEVRTLISTK